MPLPLPNLDNRTFDDLVAEGRALIPTYAPEWTNHNPSDPGITLVELFAYLAEMLIYRANRVTDENKVAFLKLLNGPTWAPPPSTPATREVVLAEAIRQTVGDLRTPKRAITTDDFEGLALAAAPQIRRAYCLPRRDLESENPAAREAAREGHVSVVVVPDRSSVDVAPTPDPALVADVRAKMEPGRLLTTQLHVVGPRYLAVRVQMTLVLQRDALESVVLSLAVARLRGFLDPLTGGPDGRGWPFGRSVYVSEVYQLLDLLPGVDYVTNVDPSSGLPRDELVVEDAERLRRNELGQLVAVQTRPDELVDGVIREQDLIVVSPLRTE